MVEAEATGTVYANQQHTAFRHLIRPAIPLAADRISPYSPDGPDAHSEIADAFQDMAGFFPTEIRATSSVSEPVLFNSMRKELA